ncbi:hypothetical protein L1887_42072 [Cichorium endivia]|nr:hypothetical protein L1887_42072 [Cichorium endivia]
MCGCGKRATRVGENKLCWRMAPSACQRRRAEEAEQSDAEQPIRLRDRRANARTRRALWSRILPLDDIDDGVRGSDHPRLGRAAVSTFAIGTLASTPAIPQTTRHGDGRTHARAYARQPARRSQAGRRRDAGKDRRALQPHHACQARIQRASPRRHCPQSHRRDSRRGQGGRAGGRVHPACRQVRPPPALHQPRARRTDEEVAARGRAGREKPNPASLRPQSSDTDLSSSKSPKHAARFDRQASKGANDLWRHIKSEA